MTDMGEYVRANKDYVVEQNEVMKNQETVRNWAAKLLEWSTTFEEMKLTPVMMVHPVNGNWCITTEEAMNRNFH